MNSNPANLLAGGFGLSDMQARPDRDAELPNCLDDRIGGANSLGRPLKRGEEPVPGGIDLATTEPVELPANRSVVGRHKLLPGTVSESDGHLGRPDDIGEQDRR